MNCRGPKRVQYNGPMLIISFQYQDTGGNRRRFSLKKRANNPRISQEYLVMQAAVEARDFHSNARLVEWHLS